MQLSLTGREFSADEALRFGLVAEISADPVQRAADIAARMSGYSPSAIHVGLGYAHGIRGLDWDHAGEVGRKSAAGFSHQRLPRRRSRRYRKAAA